jgi:hypothetical protein
MPADLKCDLSRDVNVKQMDFAKESHQLACCWLAASAKQQDEWKRTLRRVDGSGVEELTRRYLSLGYSSCSPHLGLGAIMP